MCGQNSFAISRWLEGYTTFDDIVLNAMDLNDKALNDEGLNDALLNDNQKILNGEAFKDKPKAHLKAKSEGSMTDG